MNKIKDKHKIGLIHIGKREKSGLQISEKLRQHEFVVTEWDVIEYCDQLEGISDSEVIVVNIGTVDFDYDDLLCYLFEKDIKVIINEAMLTNKLSGQKRQSWERHLLNKIDSSFSVLPIDTAQERHTESSVDFKKIGIQQVWILAASIGGPESIQQFLSAFKGDEKILFIVLQHIDKEFQPMLADQFEQCSKLSVKMPISGMKIKPSQCIIYPTDEDLHFDDKGVLDLTVINDVYSFSPCIDEGSKKLLNNIENINIAVFSGMSTDGIEAAKLVNKQGNKVITQTEESCVLSTIISGIKKEITIDFEGTPAEMANYIIQGSGQVNA